MIGQLIYDSLMRHELTPIRPGTLQAYMSMLERRLDMKKRAKKRGKHVFQLLYIQLKRINDGNRVIPVAEPRGRKRRRSNDSAN